jgi:hypothetical protein
MAALGHHGSGFVDLYHNDMHGLRESVSCIIDNFEKKKILPVRREKETYTVLEEDLAIYQLSRILDGTAHPEQTTVRVLIVRLFGEYFREIGADVVEQNYNVELLVRAFGVSSQLIFYLQQIPHPDEKAKRLLAKLLRKN